MKYRTITALLILSCTQSVFCSEKPEKLLEGFRFTEGPSVDQQGNVFFTDVPERKIYRFNPETKDLSVYLDNTGGANGLYFNQDGKLLACAGKDRKVIRIDESKNIEVLAQKYNGKLLNSPNDLWIDAKGGIYFTDPRYGNKDNLEQDGMHVYYIQPGSNNLIRVIDDLNRPNGIIGSANGKKLYVVDEGERKTYVFDIEKNGRLSAKALFCEEGIDGMSITDKGNICITTEKGVSVYSPEAELLIVYEFDVQTTNLVFHENILFVTTQSGELYRVRTTR